MSGIGILVFKVGILPLTISATMFIVGAQPLKVTALGFKVRRLPSIVRILKSVIEPKEYVSRASLLVIETLAGKVRMLIFQVGTHVQNRNSEVQGQDTFVVFRIGILAGTFGRLVFAVRALVPNSLFGGSSPLCVVNASSSALPDNSS